MCAHCSVICHSLRLLSLGDRRRHLGNNTAGSACLDETCSRGYRQLDGSLGVGEDPCPLDDAPDSWYRYSVPHTKEEEEAAASAKSVPEAKKEDDERKKKMESSFKRHKEQKPRRQVM